MKIDFKLLKKNELFLLVTVTRKTEIFNETKNLYLWKSLWGFLSTGEAALMFPNKKCLQIWMHNFFWSLTKIISFIQVDFRADITAPECPKGNQSQIHKMSIYPVSSNAQLEIEVELICKCNCNKTVNCLNVN